MLAVALMIAAAMWVQDALDTARVVFVGDGRWAIASTLDGVADIARQLSIGAGGAEIVLHRWSVAALMIAVGTFVGSVGGGGTGYLLANRYRHTPRIARGAK